VNIDLPNIWLPLQILLTLPVIIVSDEKKSSKVKLMKMYLPSTMVDKRLTSPATLDL
jgi:hypothetical protein